MSKIILIICALYVVYLNFDYIKKIIIDKCIRGWYLMYAVFPIVFVDCSLLFCYFKAKAKI